MFKVRRPSYAAVAATAALVVALGGTSYAAVSIAAGSVGTKQLKNGAVTTAKLHGSAVTSSKVKNGSLRANDMAANVLPRAYWSDSTGNTALGGSEGSPLVVESLDLPKGKFLVIGSTALTNISGTVQSAYCVLNDGTADLGRSRPLDVGSQRSTDATVTGVVTLTAATTVEFRCWATASVWIPSGSRPSISAVSVSSVEIQ